MLILFDAHSHLPRPGRPEPDHWHVVCGTCEADWAAVLAHAAGSTKVIPMLGLHPWFMAEAAPGWDLRLETLLRAHRCGVGECGLDFSRQAADRAAQETAFRTQLRLAHGLGRPLAIHAVQAWGRLLELLREEGVPPAGALVHAYSGSLETAQALQGLGVFMSFSGDLLAPNRPKAQEALRAVAADYLLLESDGTAELRQVLEAAAALRGVEPELLAAQTWENGRQCFKEWLA
jgi:TatD DNase family protein